MSGRSLSTETLLAIGGALEASDKARAGRRRALPGYGEAAPPAAGRHLAAKLRELDAALAALLTVEDRLRLDMGLIAAGVALRALADMAEGRP